MKKESDCPAPVSETRYSISSVLILLCVPLSEQKNRQNQYSRENAAGQHTCLQIVAGVLCDKSNNKWANGATHISGHGEKCEQCSSAEWNFRG